MTWSEGPQSTYTAPTKPHWDSRLFRISATDFLLFNTVSGTQEAIRLRLASDDTVSHVETVDQAGVIQLQMVTQLSSALYVFGYRMELCALSAGASSGFTFGTVETFTRPSGWSDQNGNYVIRYSDTQFAYVIAEWNDAGRVAALMVTVDPSTLTFSYPVDGSGNPAWQEVWNEADHAGLDDMIFTSYQGGSYQGGGVFLFPSAVKEGGASDWTYSWAMSIHYDDATATWSLQDGDLSPMYFRGSNSGRPENDYFADITRDDGTEAAYFAHRIFDSISGYSSPYGVVHSYDGATIDKTVSPDSGTDPTYDLGFLGDDWEVDRAFDDQMGAIGRTDSTIAVIRVDPDSTDIPVEDTWTYGGHSWAVAAGVLEVEENKTLAVWGDRDTLEWFAQVYTFAPATTLYRWDGTTWIPEMFTVWDGAAWAAKPCYRWDGTTWVPVHG